MCPRRTTHYCEGESAETLCNRSPQRGCTEWSAWSSRGHTGLKPICWPSLLVRGFRFQCPTEHACQKGLYNVEQRSVYLVRAQGCLGQIVRAWEVIILNNSRGKIFLRVGSDFTSEFYGSVLYWWLLSSFFSFSIFWHEDKKRLKYEEDSHFNRQYKLNFRS